MFITSMHLNCERQANGWRAASFAFGNWIADAYDLVVRRRGRAKSPVNGHNRPASFGG